MERGVAYRHFGGVAPAWPLERLRDAGIDDRGLDRDMLLRTAN